MAKKTKGQAIKPVNQKFDSEQAKPAKKQRGLTINGLTANIMCAVAVVVFVCVAAWLLIERNGDLLFHAQNLSFFNDTCLFFSQCMALPAGLLTWASSYLTQYFYEPALGASIMIALWVAVYFVAKKVLRVSSLWAGVMLIPCFLLLASTVDNEYWIYYIKQQGFWFMATLGFLVSMLMTWGATASNNVIYRSIALVVIAATYPLFGYYSLLTLVYVVLLDRRLVPTGVSVLLLVATPLVAYQFYANIRLIDMWIAGYTVYVADECISMTPQIPFILLAMSPVLLMFLPKVDEAKERRAVASVLVNAAVVVVGICAVEKVDFQDYNYHAEMRMYRAMEDQQWDKVLDEMGKLPNDANRQMVVFKNISLLNKGDIGNKMFAYNNKGNNPKNDYDTLRVHMVQTAAPLIYYNHAKTNFAIRWCIENSVEYGLNFNNLKILARCSIINEEWDAARKYLNILSHSRNYREWAERYMPLVDNPKLMAKYHEFDNVKDLHDNMGSVLDGDQGLCEMYLLNYFSNTMNKDSKLLQELTLDYALIQKDIELFWPRFFMYANLHKGEEMPIHYQEAALLYGSLENQVDISKMPFNREKVRDRYYSFQQMSQRLMQNGTTGKALAEAMQPMFGDTFYWFYFFCRDINSY